MASWPGAPERLAKVRADVCRFFRARAGLVGDARGSMCLGKFLVRS